MGFVTNVEIQRTSEIDQRINDLSELHGVSFEIISYNQWVDNIFNMCVDSKMVEESQLAKSWIESYVYTLAQRKRDVAPIDEPCIGWVQILKNELSKV